MGVVLVGNLRILGLMRTTSLAAIHQLLPWGLWAFVINSVTGMLFFIGQAFQYVDNPSFHFKVLFMLLAGANVLYLTLFDEVWALGPGERAPLSARLMAVLRSSCGWVIYSAHAAYLGNALKGGGEGGGKGCLRKKLDLAMRQPCPPPFLPSPYSVVMCSVVLCS